MQTTGGFKWNVSMEGRRYRTTRDTLLHSPPTEAGEFFATSKFLSLKIFGPIGGKKAN